MVVHSTHANVQKAVGFYGAMPRIVVKSSVFCGIAPKWSPRKLMNISHCIGTGRVWQRAFPDKWSDIVLPGLFFLHMFGSNVLYAKLVLLNGSPCCLRTEPSVCLSVPDDAEYKRLMAADVFCWHGAVVMATQQGQRVCVYGLCVSLTGSQWLLELIHPYCLQRSSYVTSGIMQ